MKLTFYQIRSSETTIIEAWLDLTNVKTCVFLKGINLIKPHNKNLSVFYIIIDFSKDLVKHGMKVVGCARREDKLTNLSTALNGQQGKV